MGNSQLSSDCALDFPRHRGVDRFKIGQRVKCYYGYKGSNGQLLCETMDIQKLGEYSEAKMLPTLFSERASDSYAKYYYCLVINVNQHAKMIQLAHTFDNLKFDLQSYCHDDTIRNQLVKDYKNSVTCLEIHEMFLLLLRIVPREVVQIMASFLVSRDKNGNEFIEGRNYLCLCELPHCYRRVLTNTNHHSKFPKATILDLVERAKDHEHKLQQIYSELYLDRIALQLGISSCSWLTERISQTLSD